jgi:hypothetical protein
MTSRFRRASRVLAAAGVATALLATFAAARVLAQRPPGQPSEPPAKQDAILLTIFLRHDQSKALPEINAQLDKTGFHERFPPPGVEVVSWYVMMGIGQVVTLRVPPDKLREVNLVVENGAWGAYRTDFYPTYDYKPIWEEQRRKHR